MAKSKVEKVDMESIKAYERSIRAKQERPVEKEAIDFDTWWALRLAVLKQPQHIKEILKADAYARNLQTKESCDRWDWAARQFGLTF